MVMIALCTSLIGVVLGTRLKVLVLFPATALVIAVAAIYGSTLSSMISVALILAICLQLGYLGGLLTRLCLTGSRVTSDRPLHSNLTIAE